MKRYIDKRTFKNHGVAGDGTKANCNTIFAKLHFVATELFQRRDL